jgi:NitT/TauT family transport system permease protein
MRRWVTALLFFAILLFIWQTLVDEGIWSSFLIPSPLDVGEYLVGAARDGTLWMACYVTMKRLVQGYFFGLVLGIPMGLLMARFQLLQDSVGIVALGLQALPSVCWAPLAILWFGQTENAMFFIVVMGSVWSIALATESGVKLVPPLLIRAAKTMGSTGLHLWSKVILPAALPFIITGMKQGWAFAWRSLMAAEVYITVLTGFGLGNLLHYGRELHAMEAVIGVMFVIMAIGLLIDQLVFSPLENMLHQHWGNAQTR